MYLVNGTAGIKLAEKLAVSLNSSIVDISIKRFPDNELYIRINQDLTNENIIIVQSTYPDDKIIELLILQNSVREAGAENITTIIPYYGYSRQDKRFNKGEPISAEVLAHHIQLETDKIITIDPHKDHILDFFSIPAQCVSAIPEIAKCLQEKAVDMLLAPDKGALERTKEAADIIQCDCDYLEKIRIDGNTVKMKPKNLDVKDKSVAIIDDIISTGGTMAKAIHELKKQEAEKIFAACTHGLFIGNAINKLQRAGCDEIIATDTVPNKFSKVSAAPSLIQII
jgi:ribose-phosphate pyrophosphokinase